MDSTPPKPPRLRPRAPTTPPPPPPPAETTAAAAPEPAPEPKPAPKPAAKPKKSILEHRLFRIGGGGLAASLTIHALLLLVATVWVVSVASHKNEPSSFATGAGGGRGDRVIAHHGKVRPNAPKSLTKSATKITSKNAANEIALPEMPELSRMTLNALASSSKGFGADSILGGPKGLGKGGKNFTGRSVLGMKISAAHIAVYFDNSPSMELYLNGVEKQIKEQFPTADVFRYFGIFNLNQDGEVVGSRPNQKYVIDTVEQIAANRNGGKRAAFNDPGKFSPGGRNLLSSKDAQFRTGGVGAWIDVMLQQKQYDAIVIFSDFQDGIVQYRTKDQPIPRLVFDADLPSGSDSRTDAEKAWEERWVKTFTLALDHKAPRLYLFSTEKEPQALYKRCVEASGGEFKMVTAQSAGTFGDAKMGKK